MLARLSHVRNWIFDLDNTLYPAGSGLFDLVDARMATFIARQLGIDEGTARTEQKRWFAAHGTTLNGFMAEHDVDPLAWYAFVHDIALDALEADAPLAGALARLPGRKLVFTNGDRPYALRVLDRLGLAQAFEAVHDVHAMALVPKPDPRAYAGLCEAYALDPAESLFADDMVRNLAPAKAIGMTTLWVDNGSEQAGDLLRDGIDFTTTDLSAWLHRILEDE